MQLRDVNQRSLGHSNQKLWPKLDFWEFHHVYPLEHLKSFATNLLWVYNAEFFLWAPLTIKNQQFRYYRIEIKKKKFGTPYCAVLNQDS